MRIIFTGGGTAGHILPNIAIIKELRKNLCNEEGNGAISGAISGAFDSVKQKYEIPRAIRTACEVLYIGLRDGPEKQICAKAGIDFDGIYAGKFRRYFSINNFFDLFKIPIGLIQSLFILHRFKPQVVFSKGGYVAVPVVIAAKILKIPVVIHEGDFIPGLANKICAKFADKVCVAFPETRGFDPNKIILTGMPVRDVNEGKTHRQKQNRPTGAERVEEGEARIQKQNIVMKSEQKDEDSFKNNAKPVVLIMGGSLGAESINRAVWKILPKLLLHANIIHITGKGKSGIKFISAKLDNYKQIEYADDELFDFYAQSSLVVSRAGASAIAEIAAQNKPSILIPLGKKASRGEQTANAEYMRSIGASEVIYQNENFENELEKKIINLLNNKKKLRDMSSAAKKFGELCKNSAHTIAKILLSYS